MATATDPKEPPAQMTDPAAAPARRGPVKAVLKTMRPGEWIKNSLVFAGVLFSVRFDEFEPMLAATITFAAFCLVSSAGYLLNDAHDADLDRQHPTKRFRPIAAGELSVGWARWIAALLAVIALAGSFAAEGALVAVMVAGYGIGTTLYSYVLKTEVILDVMTISGLFVLRVLAGAEAVDADASAFLLLCTGMVALFLGFTKRRQEASSELHSGTKTRPVLEHYSIPFLDQMVAMVTAATVMSYAIYAVNSPVIGSKMLATLPPVVYGIFRYLYLIYDRKDTRSTAEMLAGDYGMIGAALVWVGTAVAMLAIYGT